MHPRQKKNTKSADRSDIETSCRAPRRLLPWCDRFARPSKSCEMPAPASWGPLRTPNVPMRMSTSSIPSHPPPRGRAPVSRRHTVNRGALVVVHRMGRELLRQARPQGRLQIPSVCGQCPPCLVRTTAHRPAPPPRKNHPRCTRRRCDTSQVSVAEPGMPDASQLRQLLALPRAGNVLWILPQ